MQALIIESASFVHSNTLTAFWGYGTTVKMVACNTSDSGLIPAAARWGWNWHNNFVVMLAYIVDFNKLSLAAPSISVRVSTKCRKNHIRPPREGLSCNLQACKVLNRPAPDLFNPFLLNIIFVFHPTSGREKWKFVLKWKFDEKNSSNLWLSSIFLKSVKVVTRLFFSVAWTLFYCRCDPGGGVGVAARCGPGFDSQQRCFHPKVPVELFSISLDDTLLGYRFFLFFLDLFL